MRRHEESPTAPAPVPPPQPESQESVLRRRGVHAKALRIRAYLSEIGRTPGCPACETPGPVKSHTRERKTFQDFWEERRRTATPEEVKRGIVVDPDTPALDPSSSSTDVKFGVATDVENSAGQMDEDTFLRALAIFHPLEPDAEENDSKKARVARNLLHIRGEHELKFDVDEEAWPIADLAVRSSFECALIDEHPADRVKAGDEREITQMKDLQLYSWVKEADAPPGKSILLTGWAQRMQGNEVRSRCVLEDLAKTVRDDVFAPMTSPVSVRGLLLYAAWCDLHVETGDVVCASMQADSFCEMFARPPKGQEREGLDLATAWSDARHANGYPSFYIIFIWHTDRMHGFYTWQAGTMSFCARVERDTSCISRRRPLILCKTSDIGEILAAHHRAGGDQREAKRSTRAYLGCTWDSNTAVFKSLNAEDLL